MDINETATKQVKKYSLVSFTGEVTSEGLQEVDCVPSSWIRYDHDMCSCVAQYPSPPYTGEDEKLLQDLIILQAKAPADWPWYPVELRGHAGKFYYSSHLLHAFPLSSEFISLLCFSETYEIGMKRIKVLGKKPYAFSTDSESHAEKKAKEITDVFKKKRNPVSKTVKEILSISEHSSSSENDDDPSDERKYDSSVG